LQNDTNIKLSQDSSIHSTIRDMATNGNGFTMPILLLNQSTPILFKKKMEIKKIYFRI